MAVFNKCCFCVPLRPGCLVIGYLNLILSIGGICLSIATILAGVDLQKSPKGDETEKGTATICFGVVILIYHVIHFVFCIILLIGIHKDIPKYVKAFLIFSLVLIICSIILFIARIVSGTITVALAVKDVIELVLNIYFLLVIKSYYDEM